MAGRPKKPSPGAGRTVFGMNPVRELLRRRPEEIERLYLADPSAHGPLVAQAKELGLVVERASKDALSDLAEGGVHQGVVAVVREFAYLELHELIAQAKDSDRPALVVVLDGIQDPHNLGAIIRSAHALGAHGVVIPKDRAVQVTGTVAKASAGAIEHCPIARVTNLSRALEELKEAGLWVVAAHPDGSRDLPTLDLKGPMAVVIGAEGSGVREGVLKHSDFRARIPMEGDVASLNASVSAGILLYEILRQRTVA